MTNYMVNNNIPMVEFNGLDQNPPQRSTAGLGNISVDAQFLWWKLRTPLEKCLIPLCAFGCFAFFGLIIAIVISICLPFSVFRRQNNVCLTRECVKTAAKILNNIDQSVSPCKDFYNFACGGWIRSVVVPENESVISTFSETQNQIDMQLKEILEKPISVNDSKTIENLKNVFTSCLNDPSVDSNTSVEQLLKMIKDFGGWPVMDGDKWNMSKFDWIQTIGMMREMGFKHNVFLHFRVAPNIKFNSRHAIYFTEPNFGGLERHHLWEGINNPKVKMYHKLMVDTAVEFGVNRSIAEIQMKDALELEIMIAQTSSDNNRFQSYTINEVQRFAPYTPWTILLNNVLQLNESDEIVETDRVMVQRNEAVRELDALFQKYHTKNRRALANFIIWRVVVQSLWSLGGRFKTLTRDFSNITRPDLMNLKRWKLCLYTLSGSIPIAISFLYVMNVNDRDKRRIMANEIVNDIRETFNKELDRIDWMDEETRCSAKHKAKKMNQFVGYSDEIINETLIDEYYESMLNLSKNDLFQNILTIRKWTFDNEYEKFRLPNNRSEWHQSNKLTAVNAYYSPLSNSIKIPTGILQGMFFSYNRPQYLNYGSLGYVIGHEITHGFDTKGGRFDKRGNFRDWWDVEVWQTFYEKGMCMVQQYQQFNLSYGLKINGHVTLPENIADNGGIKEAYKGYNEFIKRNGPEPSLPGVKYSPLQLFWISAANIWCRKYTKEGYRNFVRSNAHTLSKFRVIVPFSNAKEFSETFDCPIGSPMNPIHKCEIW